jgi:hypothetical protein
MYYSYHLGEDQYLRIGKSLNHRKLEIVHQALGIGKEGESSKVVLSGSAK